MQATVVTSLQKV